ncbi:MAG: hypothetical protein ABSF67_10370 [Roseiarcus sp.]|jgi:hypothetical protein
MTDQKTPKAKRYVVSLIADQGTDHEAMRDSGIVFAIDDAVAWNQATKWAAASAYSVDGDYLQLAKDGRGIKGSSIRKVA